MARQVKQSEITKNIASRLQSLRKDKRLDAGTTSLRSRHGAYSESDAYFMAIMMRKVTTVQSW